MDPEAFVQLVQTGGGVASLAIFLFGFWKGWWVAGFTYMREVQRHDETRTELHDARQEIGRLNERIHSDVIPPLVRVTDLLAERVEKRAGGGGRSGR